ncbi:hypothetical protein HDV05_006512 [Chytridiales sp. JEL 0842]|nr:hypothetical protein HDV05_006512 [Chytridiales sp. JEL 0842]
MFGLLSPTTHPSNGVADGKSQHWVIGVTLATVFGIGVASTVIASTAGFTSRDGYQQRRWTGGRRPGAFKKKKNNNNNNNKYGGRHSSHHSNRQDNGNHRDGMRRREYVEEEDVTEGVNKLLRQLGVDEVKPPVFPQGPGKVLKGFADVQEERAAKVAGVVERRTSGGEWGASKGSQLGEASGLHDSSTSHENTAQASSSASSASKSHTPSTQPNPVTLPIPITPQTPSTSHPTPRALPPHTAHPLSLSVSTTCTASSFNSTTTSDPLKSDPPPVLSPTSSVISETESETGSENSGGFTARAVVTDDSQFYQQGVSSAASGVGGGDLGAEVTRLRQQLAISRQANKKLEAQVRVLKRNKDALLESVKALKLDVRSERDSRFVMERCLNERLKKMELDLDFKENEIVELRDRQREMDAEMEERFFYEEPAGGAGGTVCANCGALTTTNTGSSSLRSSRVGGGQSSSSASGGGGASTSSPSPSAPSASTPSGGGGRVRLNSSHIPASAFSALSDSSKTRRYEDEEGYGSEESFDSQLSTTSTSPTLTDPHHQQQPAPPPPEPHSTPFFKEACNLLHQELISEASPSTIQIDLTDLAHTHSATPIECLRVVVEGLLRFLESRETLPPTKKKNPTAQEDVLANTLSRYKTLVSAFVDSNAAEVHLLNLLEERCLDPKRPGRVQRHLQVLMGLYRLELFEPPAGVHWFEQSWPEGEEGGLHLWKGEGMGEGGVLRDLARPFINWLKENDGAGTSEEEEVGGGSGGSEAGSDDEEEEEEEGEEGEGKEDEEIFEFEEHDEDVFEEGEGEEDDVGIVFERSEGSEGSEEEEGEESDDESDDELGAPLTKKVTFCSVVKECCMPSCVSDAEEEEEDEEKEEEK